MKLNRVLFLSFFIFGYSLVAAQSYIGHTVDNYSGIHGGIYNPAALVDSKMNIDVNIASVSAFGASDYFGIKLNNLIKKDSRFDFDEQTQTFPSNSNNFFLNIDVMGPSVLLNLNDNNSIALISRARSFGNINKINGEFFENIENDFDATEDFDFENDEFTGTIHVWGELGFSYGRVLYNKNNHKLKAGLTAKYLQGMGVAFMSTLGMQGHYNAANNALSTNGDLIYGFSSGFDPDDVQYKNAGSGFGADIGMTYQWSNPKANRENKAAYKLKLGLSVTDIGSIKYTKVEVNNYDLDKTVNAADFELANLDELYDYTSVNTDSKISLPTVLHIQADYNITNGFYISAQGDFSLVKPDQPQKSSSLNTVIFTPRFESKWFSVYVPFGFRQYEDFGCGLGLRAGPLTIGSGSILTNLISDTSKSADIYVGLKVPIYK